MFSPAYINTTLRMYLNSQAGFRGVSLIFKELQNYFDIKDVSYCCIRQWVLRLGYGILQQPPQKRNDWIYIVDFSIQLGKERCLLILGITMESLKAHGYQLKHQHVTVLDIYVQEHFDGFSVYQQLNAVKHKTGIPYQIISDKGNDVKKGIDLFLDENPRVFDTYDITHMIGLYMKYYLGADNRWIELQECLMKLNHRVKQTDMSFLRPLKPRNKARWLNIDKIIQWLENIFQYEENGEFHLISEGKIISNQEEILTTYKEGCRNKNKQKAFGKFLKNSVFSDETEAKMALERYGVVPEEGIKLIEAGKNRFDEKFSPLKPYKQYFEELKELKHMAETTKSIIKNEGLSRESLRKLEIEYETLTWSWIKNMFHPIIQHLHSDLSKSGSPPIPLLYCSDVIESVFGKFKMKAGEGVGGIHETVLNITLFCNDLTDDLIRSILTTTKMSDVEEWFKNMLGTSNLAKRRTAFNFYT